MNLLITGGDGRLGRALHQLALKGGHQVTAVNHSQLDITDWDAVRAMIRDLRPDAVLHPAAWTNVDGCAQNPAEALRINSYGAGNVAAAAANVGAWMLYVSSNEVFDGERPHGTYTEYDMPRPINAYGMSKYSGEQAVIQTNPRHMIVRTAWLFAHGGKNFLQTMIGAARDGKALRVVADEVGNPTYTDDLAAAMLQLTATQRPGIYHGVNSGAVSRWGFARYTLDRAGFGHIPIAKIARREWRRPSTPPAYTALANINAAALGIPLRSWQSAVDAFLKREGLFVE